MTENIDTKELPLDLSKSDTPEVVNSHQESEQPPEPHEKIIRELQEYLDDLECLYEMFETVVPVLEEKDKERHEEIKDVVKYFASLKKDEINPAKIELLDNIKKLTRNVTKLEKAGHMFRSNSIVSIVASFEELYACILRTMYLVVPDKLKSDDKTLSYKEILKFQSIDEAIDRCIQREIDSIIYSSHADQIKFLDKELKLGIEENFTAWEKFIEITQRRHILIHCGGHVSHQYIQKCGRHQVTLCKDVKLGDKLTIDGQYFNDSYMCFYELGFRLGISSLYRLFPQHLDLIDDCLNDIGYNLLTQEKWDLALLVFDYAISLPKKFIKDDKTFKRYVINKCIAIKYLYGTEKMKKILNAVDWSSANGVYILAVHVLNEEYDEAESVMSKMPKDGKIDEYGFGDWPLFKDFRNTDNFNRAFKDIFSKEFEPKIIEPDEKQEDSSSQKVNIIAEQCAQVDPHTGSSPQ